MVSRRRKPGFGTERAAKRVPREPVERSERSDVSEYWEDEAEMEQLQEKKREAEEAEPYNQTSAMRKSKLVAREAARRSLGLRSDQPFELPSSTSPEQLPVAEDAVEPVLADEEENSEAFAVERAEEDRPAKRQRKKAQKLQLEPSSTVKPGVKHKGMKDVIDHIGSTKWEAKSKRAKQHTRQSLRKRKLKQLAAVDAAEEEAAERERWGL